MDMLTAEPISRKSRNGTPGGATWRAFTLMEVLVALSVLSVALVAIYQSFAATAQINQASGGLWKAMVHVNNELARIERAPTPSVGILQGVYRDDHPLAGTEWRRIVADEEPLPGIKVRRVEFELIWDVAGAEQTYRAELYVPPTGQ